MSNLNELKSLEELNKLKILAYDLIVLINNSQNELKMVNAKISELSILAHNKESEKKLEEPKKT